MYDGHWFGGGLMWLFWVLLIVAIVWAVRLAAGGSEPGSRRGEDKSPRQILEERLARGEIDETEFERKRKLLHD